MHTWFTRACVTAGTSIGDNQFGQFQLSVGTLPTADGSEPDRPAPTVRLAAATSASAASDATARWLGGVGLALGTLGLARGGAAALRSRSRS